MDYLREGIHLRGFAQIDPLVAYKNEGFTMFQELMASIWEEFVRVIFHVEVNIEPAQAEQMFGEEQRRRGGDVQYSGAAGEERPSAIAEAQSGAVATAAASGTAAAAAAGGGNGQGDPNPTTVVRTEDEKIGRNDPCWCGSGKKYKKCHGA
jgi:preprotein translocase subunit SecA